MEELEFIFTAPTFVAGQATDKVKKERREFYIPQAQRESSLYGSEFEIRLRNRLTQRAIARECADWIKRKVTFKSNKTGAPMQQFAVVDDRAHQRLVVCRVEYLERLGGSGQAVAELRIDRVLDDHAARGSALLAGVSHGGVRDRRGCAVKVSVSQDDGGVLATHLGLHAGAALGRMPADLPADL